jgi:hypothetical protein
MKWEKTTPSAVRIRFAAKPGTRAEIVSLQRLLKIKCSRVKHSGANHLKTRSAVIQKRSYLKAQLIKHG